KMYVVFYVSPQLSSGNPVYEKYYKQVDPSGSGQVAAADAALFLKRSGLADLVLGKVWDLADSERKGCLNKQQFFIALRLVACAQNGLEVALKSIHLAVSLPKFQDTSSPLLLGGVSIDSPWVVTTEEKLKFDAVFVSLSPVSGMLSGEKVKPVLLNSKLPVDVLGRVWELSDLDRDGMLDRDEFAVAMYLVYRALEGEPVPMSLPAPLVPPSKRKKPPVSVPPVMPLIPSPPSIKESRSSLSGSKTLPSKPAWAVSPPDKSKYDEVFAKTDLDMDGMVSGPEVRDIFLKTGLPSATLAHIWELCDIGDMGKLTREQFALALHLINQKLTTGVDPPQNLSPEMIPPSDRLSLATKQVGSPSTNLAADFSAIKELDSLSNEIVDLQREKSNVEQEIKEQEKSIRERTSEVQDLQNQVQKESGELQRLQSQRQEVQDTLEELDQQKTTLEEQLRHICQQCSHENQLILSLEAEHTAQEQRIEEYEEQLVQAREELLRLQEESQQLEEKVQAAREQFTPLQESVKDSFSQVSQSQLILLSVCAEDPFKDDLFGKADVSDPFGGDPFKGTDPFSADSFFKQSSASPFPSADPFSALRSTTWMRIPTNDPFAPGGTAGNTGSDPDPFAAVFGIESFGVGFADFSALAKSNGADPFASSNSSNNKNLFKEDSQPSSLDVPPALPPKTGTPTRPPPPPPGQSFWKNMLLLRCSDVCVFLCGVKQQYHTEEDMIEWAKRESEREEKERLARQAQQEQEDLELAIALSKSEFS
uniref:Epidermal growth factor receptor pathway substrate 15 n=1 Tax=Oncorhynchus mykiss TaxID=8022 RepID=A0A8C7NHZ4_ONCMY